MNYRFSNKQDIMLISDILTRNSNSPLNTDMMRLIKVWQTSEEARKLLSFEFNVRTGESNINIDSNICLNGTYHRADFYIGRGLIAPFITRSVLSVGVSKSLNNVSAWLDIETTAPTHTIDVINLLNKCGYKDALMVMNEGYIRIPFRLFNINDVLNILSSIQASCVQRQYTAVKRDWI